MNKPSIMRVTTNIDSSLLDFIDQSAKERQITRREVIEESIRASQRTSNRQSLIDGYNRLADDEQYTKEVLRVANNSANL